MPRSLAIGQAANFQSALSQCLTRTNNSGLQITGDFFLAVQYIPTTAASTQVLASKRANGGATEYVLYCDGSIFNFTVGSLASSGASASQAQVSLAQVAGTRYFILAWFDSSTGKVSIQVNNGTVTTAGTSIAAAWTSTNSFCLGADDQGTANFTNGTIDAAVIGKPPTAIGSLISGINTAIYNSGVGLSARSLTAAQIAAWGAISGWDFDSNGLLVDAIGTNTLTNNGGVTQVKGIVPAVRTQLATARTLSLGQAANGKRALSQDLSVAYNSTFALTGDFAMACWVRFGDFGDYNVFFSIQGQTAHLFGFTTSGRIFFNVDWASGTVSLDSGVTPSVGSWYFVLAWYDSAGQTINVKINNGTTATAAFTNTPKNPAAGTTNILSRGAFYTQGSVDAGIWMKPSTPIAGVIAAINTALWNSGSGFSGKSLTAAQIAAWGVVSAWDFDLNGLLVDAVGTNTLTNNNGVTQVPGIVPSVRTSLGGLAAANFDGSTQSLTVASNAGLQTGNIDFWCACWVMFKALPNDGLIQGIFTKSDGVSRDYRLWLINNGPTSLFEWTAFGAGGAASTFTPVLVGVPYLMMGYYDQVNGLNGISINGQAFQTTASTGPATTGNGQVAIGNEPVAAERFLNGYAWNAVFGKSPVGGITGLATTIRDALWNNSLGLRAGSISSAQRTAWGVVSAWNCDGSGNQLIADSVGNNQLTNNGATPMALISRRSLVA